MKDEILGELLGLWANVPLLLTFRRMERAYMKELEYELHCHYDTVKRSATYLLEAGLIEEMASDRRIPNVMTEMKLTPLGKEIADCIQDCETEIGLKLRRRK